MNFNLTTAEEVLSQLALRLRAQRLAQELTQQNLARMAGLSLGAVRKLESDGQCSLETLIRVTQALGLVAELEPLFAQKPESIAAMQRAAKIKLRQRAPRNTQR
jgi:transcriptional regulator with XRE-family HTH domain